MPTASILRLMRLKARVEADNAGNAIVSRDRPSRSGRCVDSTTLGRSSEGLHNPSADSCPLKINGATLRGGYWQAACILRRRSGETDKDANERSHTWEADSSSTSESYNITADFDKDVNASM